MKIKIIFTLTILLCGFAVLAQPPGPPATPIDGGLGLLIAAGAVYGVKKIRENSKR